MNSIDIHTHISQIAAAMMRQDGEVLAAFFADDAVMIVPSNRYEGRQAIYEACQAFNSAYSPIVIEIKDVIACGNNGVVEWAFTETRKSDGWTHTMDDAIVFRLRDDGAILYWREYFDPAQ